MKPELYKYRMLIIRLCVVCVSARLVLFSFFNDVFEPVFFQSGMVVQHTASLITLKSKQFNLKLNYLVEIYILHLYIHSMHSVLNERLLIFIAKRRHNNCLDYSPPVIKLKKDTHLFTQDLTTRAASPNKGQAMKSKELSVDHCDKIVLHHR